MVGRSRGSGADCAGPGLSSFSASCVILGMLLTLLASISLPVKMEITQLPWRLKERAQLPGTVSDILRAP